MYVLYRRTFYRSNFQQETHYISFSKNITSFTSTCIFNIFVKICVYLNQVFTIYGNYAKICKIFELHVLRNIFCLLIDPFDCILTIRLGWGKLTRGITNCTFCFTYSIVLIQEKSILGWYFNKMTLCQKIFQFPVFIHSCSSFYFLPITGNISTMYDISVGNIRVSDIPLFEFPSVQ